MFELQIETWLEASFCYAPICPYKIRFSATLVEWINGRMYCTFSPEGTVDSSNKGYLQVPWEYAHLVKEGKRQQKIQGVAG
jgi:hypothetical protein